ncbi:MAG TPA: resolvase, partial [Leptolyngbya sp.]|nr:resolvase [Leptolyngbya sp.]
MAEQPVILGFDPGRQKCGLAVMGVDRRVYYHEVIGAEVTIETIRCLRDRFPISLLVMGDQTSSKAWKQKLEAELAEPMRVI